MMGLVLRFAKLMIRTDTSINTAEFPSNQNVALGLQCPVRLEGARQSRSSWRDPVLHMDQKKGLRSSLWENDRSPNVERSVFVDQFIGNFLDEP
jgi:hypothetical protein